MTQKVNLTAQFQVTHECKLVRGLMTLELNWYIKTLCQYIYVIKNLLRDRNSKEFLVR